MADHEFGIAVDDDEDFDLSNVEETPRKQKKVSGAKNTVYDLMRQELSKPATTEKSVVLAVGKSRPGFSVRFSTDLDLEQLDRWRIRSRKKPGKEPIDLRLYNSYVISSQCTAILYHGEEVPVPGEEDEFLTFDSEDLWDMVGAVDFASAVKNFYDRDADIIKTGTKILEACGYIESDDEDDSDPLDSERD